MDINSQTLRGWGGAVTSFPEHAAALEEVEQFRRAGGGAGYVSLFIPSHWALCKSFAGYTQLSGIIANIIQF